MPKHRQRQWRSCDCAAKSAKGSTVGGKHGRNQNRRWLPLHQLTHWNQINPLGVTLPSGILHRKWRAMRDAALARWARTTQKKAPNRCKRKASRGEDTKQMLLLCVRPPPLRVCAKRGAVIWSVLCWSIQPWEVSKPSDLIRARRVPGAEWRIDLPITWQRVSIKQQLFTWHERNEQGETNKDSEAQRSEETAYLKRPTRIPAVWRIKQHRAAPSALREKLKRWSCLA